LTTSIAAKAAKTSSVPGTASSGRNPSAFFGAEASDIGYFHFAFVAFACLAMIGRGIKQSNL
jgi:hypothetical protein